MKKGRKNNTFWDCDARWTQKCVDLYFQIDTITLTICGTLFANQ